MSNAKTSQAIVSVGTLIVAQMAAAFLFSAAPQQSISKQASPPSVQVGYAVITPASNAATGLVVFETFGERRISETTQAGVLPADMTTHSVLFVSTNSHLSRNLGVAIANPGNAAAHIVLTLLDNTGAEVAKGTTTVPPGNQISEFVTQIFSSQPSITNGLTGTLDISSDVPVAAIGLRFRGMNFSTLPTTDLTFPSPAPLIANNIGGPGAVILPQFAVSGGWATEFVLMNTGSAALTVRVDLFGQDGKPLVTTLNGTSASSFAGIVIPPGGVVTLAPLDPDGDNDF